MPLITNYGRFWERSKLSELADGKINRNWKWDDVFWKGKRRGQIHGIYVLYRGMTPVYVGKATGRWGIFKRLQHHHRDWLAPIWDNVCWYMFDNHKDIDKTINVVESLLIASIPGLLNSAQPGAQLGKECFPENEDGKETNYGQNMLWTKIT